MFSRQFIQMFFVCAPALLATLAVAQSGPGDSQGGQSATIEGTWIVTVDRVQQNTTFSALQSFTAGGVVLATGTLDRMPPPPISPLYGSWTRTGNNTYVVTLNFFIFDPAGNAVLMFQNNQTYQLINDNNLVGVGTACTWDVIGGIIQNGPGKTCAPLAASVTITGTRLIARGTN
jgi:hypothetical protein